MAEVNQKNPFKEMEPKNKAPDGVKNKVTESVGLLRFIARVIELFTGNIIQSVVKTVDDNSGIVEGENELRKEEDITTKSNLNNQNNSDEEIFPGHR